MCWLIGCVFVFWRVVFAAWNPDCVKSEVIHNKNCSFSLLSNLMWTSHLPQQLKSPHICNKQTHLLFPAFFLKHRKFQHFCVDSAHQSGLIALKIRDQGLVLIRLLSHTLLSRCAGFHFKPSLELHTAAQAMPTLTYFPDCRVLCFGYASV